MDHRQSYKALRGKYDAGELSPVRVAESALDHAVAVNGTLNAFALLDHRRALTAAAASEARWCAGIPLSPIDGMPITVKEFAAVKSWPSRRGSLITSSEPLAESAVFVQRLEDAGAVLLGKTRAPEFNWKGVTDSPGFGITRNPWNPAFTPGGSSGGCSAAVAAGVVRVSVGSDAGGSVRIPAAFCGLIGLKPTFGRIPATPLPSAFQNIVHSGPIAASVGDLADVFNVIAGPSSRDWTSMGLAEMSEGIPLDRLRVGLLKPERWSDSDAAVKAGMQQMLNLLARKGVSMQEVDYDIRVASDVGAFFYRVGCAAAVNAIADGDREKLDPGLLRFVRSVENAQLKDMLDMLKQRDESANRLADLFDRVDVLVLPTLPLAAMEAGRDTPVGWRSDDWMSWNPYTSAFNVTQVPALSYPVWPAGSEFPMGVQFVAPKCREDILLKLSAWLEDHLPVRTVPA